MRVPSNPGSGVNVPINILIVEDDHATSSHIRGVLEKYGYAVAGVATSGKQAVEMASDLRPSLVLMDILLEGDIDGVGAAQLIGSKWNIPIIYLTAYADERTLERAKITEPYGFVMKPFDDLQLHATIQVALSRLLVETAKQDADAAFVILHNLVDAVIITDEKGFVTFLNPTAEKLTGWAAKEAQGKAWTEVFNITKETPGALGDSSITTGLHDSAILMTRENTRTAVEYSATLLKDAAGMNTGFAFLFRDVTRHRHFEQTLAESRKKYKELVNSIDGVVWEGDQNRQFTFVSKQAQKLLGYPAETWLNEPPFWKEHIHPEDRKWAVSFCQKAIAERKDVELEYRMMHSDTRSVWIREILNVGLDSKNEIILRGIMLDMTERKRMETALRKAHDELEYRVYERTTELSAALDALRESERKYRMLVEGMTEGILQDDKEGRILLVNPRLCEMLEYPAEDLVGKNAIDLLVLPEDQELMKEKNRLRTQGISDQYEIRIRKKSGDTIWVQISGAPVMGIKGVVGSMGIFTDITARKFAEKALRESEERYALAVTGANDGLWDWDLKTNKIYFSERWISMLGYGLEEVSNSPDEWFKRVHPDDFQRLKAEINSHLQGNISQLQNEHRMLHQDGSYRWMLSRGVAVRDAQGAYRMAGSQTDVTERKLAVEQLLHDAFHDALTNLSNRALFMDRLSGASARSISRARRGGKYLFAVLFLDLDRFKVINDSLGHLMGDQLLISIARRLEKCLRPGDTIARLGGDEFAILIEDILDIEDAITVAKRIQGDLQTPLEVGEHEVFTSASIGIAISSGKYEKAEDLLRDADTAMYRAKAMGKARYEVFSESMHGKAVALLQLETDLRRAIERNEFRIYYQPIVALENRKVIGFEALVRWQHPERGLLMPEEIIPIAEETGLIIPIDQWVLREACRQMRFWQEKGLVDAEITMSVNLSGRQFSQRSLSDYIAWILHDTGLAPQYLKLEITESVIMENAEFAATVLHHLRELNVGLQIDDFGTGYSSLSYLHRFPINTLKIDRSFVSAVGTQRGNWEIVRTILTLASNLGMHAIAEGVETEEQLEHLISLGCQYGQGFLFAEPMDAVQVEKLLERRSELTPF